VWPAAARSLDSSRSDRTGAIARRAELARRPALSRPPFWLGRRYGCAACVTLAPRRGTMRTWLSNTHARSRGTRLRFALETEFLPHRIDAALDGVVHDDWTAPGARGLSRPLVGRVDAHLCAQAGDWRSEVEIVDRRVLDDQRIASGIDARGKRPDHLLPVADVH